MKFFGSRGSWTSPLIWLRFQLQFKVSNLRFINSDSLIQECLTSTWNLCFCNVVISRRFCFCSTVKQLGTHWAQIFLFWKSFVKIRNTEGEIPVASNISPHVTWPSCARKFVTSFTLRLSVDVFGLPGLRSSFLVTCPSRKQVDQQETILRSTVYSPQTSRKALWISVGFLPRKVSNFMYNLWSSTVTVPEAPADAISNTR